MTSAISTTATASASEIWSGASPAMTPDQKMNQLFDQIDPNGAGSVTQDKFAQAFKMLNPPTNFKSFGADSTWQELDPTSSGGVSKKDFVNTMTSLMKELRGNSRSHGAASGETQTIDQSISSLNAPSMAPNLGSSSVGTQLDTIA